MHAINSSIAYACIRGSTEVTTAMGRFSRVASAMCIEAMGGSAADFQKLIDAEVQRWSEVVRKSGAKAD